MEKEVITKRQKELLSIIYEYIKDTGYPPTFEDMRERLNVSSNQSIIDLLEKIKNKGLIKREEGARTISILPLGYDTIDKPTLSAFLGTASAGIPLESIDAHGEWQIIPSYIGEERLEQLKDNIFLLRISGDSMINAGINDGAIVLVKTQKEFVSGDVVYAQIGDSATVKRFISENKPPFLYLKPENPKYDIIHFTEDVSLKGKIISIIKNGQWRLIH
ncbi:MAG: LexA repressor [Candidatus Falkowbacteria bacterium GW2011_GWA2_39_24]|uniref:LexA repressor n=1 Tax=Candidatus Falkowbacteria bacterium GW2011_GWA2_39_24 TaxID=1618634 RepID=A0A0G0NE31_9BACT|nr:MAG: LexA repressor [Candidatus Falkowbacteria bacterium GW2011_GWA2_39_24]